MLVGDMIGLPKMQTVDVEWEGALDACFQSGQMEFLTCQMP